MEPAPSRPTSEGHVSTLLSHLDKTRSPERYFPFKLSNNNSVCITSFPRVLYFPAFAWLAVIIGLFFMEEYNLWSSSLWIFWILLLLVCSLTQIFSGIHFVRSNQGTYLRRQSPLVCLARQGHNVPLTFRHLWIYHTVRAQYRSKLPKSSVSRLGLRIFHSVCSSISAPLGNYLPAGTTVLPGHNNITAKATLEHGAETWVLAKGTREDWMKRDFCDICYVTQLWMKYRKLRKMKCLKKNFERILATLHVQIENRQN